MDLDHKVQPLSGWCLILTKYSITYLPDTVISKDNPLPFVNLFVLILESSLASPISYDNVLTGIQAQKHLHSSSLHRFSLT